MDSEAAFADPQEAVVLDRRANPSKGASAALAILFGLAPCAGFAETISGLVFVDSNDVMPGRSRVMSTIASTVASPIEALEVSTLQKERAFFFYMALAIFVTAFAGFGGFLARGRSSFASPWWVHVHAVSLATWTLLYVAQNWLVWRGRVGGHRRLGILGGVWSLWIFVSGIAVTVMTIKAHRMPPIEPSFFLVLDWLLLAIFASLAWAALRLRARPDWHKRLMLGAMISLLPPAWGRLIPPGLIHGQEGIVIIEMLILLGYFGVAMAYDRRMRGSVHPAYYWGAGAVVAWVPLILALAPLPLVVALAHRITG